MLEVRMLTKSGARIVFHTDIPNTRENRKNLERYCIDYCERILDKFYGAYLVELSTNDIYYIGG